MKKRFFEKEHTILAAIMAMLTLAAAVAAVLLRTSIPVLAAPGADEADQATVRDLADADIIDMSKTGSISIYKYDITAAQAAGAYRIGTYKATGESDSRVEQALTGYGIEGVQFSYLRAGNIETHSVKQETGNFLEIVYEIPVSLAKILRLSELESVDMTGDGEAFPCENGGVWHFTSQQISDALAAILKEDNVAAKNALEQYFYDYGTMDVTVDQTALGAVANMPKTDKNGYTHVEGLELGLYLVVETEVPEQVVETTDPWFVSLPFTNTSAQEMKADGTYASSGVHDVDGVTNSEAADGAAAGTSGGEKWLYDMVCYPKNQTGNPTLDKRVRNAYGNPAEAKNAENSTDFEYRDTTTASEGDVLDYILVSKLPHISSPATFLSEYTFTDILSEGLTYNQDVKIAFYHTAADAKENQVANADFIWDIYDGSYAQEYVDVTVSNPLSHMEETDGSTKLTVRLTETGLSILNGTQDTDAAQELSGIQENGTQVGLSDYYMVVYYTVTVNSDATVVLGDDGNENNVLLTWGRTSDGYCNTLEDRNYVYAYSIDLTKTFSDQKGEFANVQFKLYNSTDAYYVVARQEADGLYYVTGKSKDKAEGTTFVPNAKTGSLIIHGLEADRYQMTEVATDDGYMLLKEQIVIEITATDRDVIAAVAGVTGMTEEDMEAIVSYYQGGIYNENGELVTAGRDALTGADASRPAIQTANGRTIGKTDLYVGAIRPARATVDQISAVMRAQAYTRGNLAGTQESANAAVVMKVQNNKNFRLPLTGGNGGYGVMILGVFVSAVGFFLIGRKKSRSVR